MINPSTLKPFGKFCITLGMLPTSYKASLTYEEQLLWFCDYLENKVIPALNNNAEALQEVQALYEEMRQFIVEYFSKLDVQEEIDNKLDEMAQDGTLDDIINQNIFAELNDKITIAENNINELQSDFKTYPYFDILINGGFSDGQTPNDTIFSDAKNNGFTKFYFPQNENNNAIYYFDNIPSFNDCEIITDKNVIISLPSAFTNIYTNDIIANSNIKFLYRNQQQTAITSQNNSNFFNMLHVPFDYRLKNLDGIVFNYSNLKLFHYKYDDDFLFEEVTKSDIYQENDLFLSKVSGTSQNYYNGLCVPITNYKNCIETCTNGNNTKVDYVLLNSQTGVGILASYTGNGIIVYYNNQTGTYLQALNLFTHNISHSNDWELPCQYKMRYLKNKNIVQFLFNNQIVAEYALDFTPDYFGFGISSNDISQKMSRFITYYQSNLPLNYNMRILIVGDSRFAGDGQTYKINEILKNGLLYNGINDIIIDNLAVSGYSIEQIYNVLQNTDLSLYDVIIYEGGINNYLTSYSEIAYKLNDTARLLQNSGALVVFTTCMPCSWRWFR